MSGNAKQTDASGDLKQMAEFLGSATKALALVAPKMTKAARQSWIGMPPAEFAGVLEKLVFLPSDAGKTESSALPQSKPAEKPLLVRIGEPRSVAAVESFVVSEKFREGETTDGVKIWSLGSNFKTYALPHIERGVPEGSLVTDRLERNSRDEKIMIAAGEQLKNSLAHFFDFLKTASHGNWYFSYVEINDVLWAVGARWDGGVGWGVELSRVPGPGDWYRGGVLVSRRHSIA